MDLSLAVKSGDYARLEKLLKNGANVNFVDENGVSLLHQAVNFGRENVVRVLLKNKADVLKVTRDKGNTALHVAVAKKNASIVAALLENISREKLHKLLDVKTKKTGSTALHIAAKTHCYEIAKILLINGAIYNVKDKEGKQPVDFVEGEVLEALLKVIEINFSLVEFGDPELYVRLMEQPLDEYLCMSNCRDGEGRTLFQKALKENHVDTVEFLVGMRCERSSYFPQTNTEALNELATSFENYTVTSNELLTKLMRDIYDPSVALREGNCLMNEVRKLLQSYRTYEQKLSKSIRILNIRSIEEALEFFDRDIDYRKLLQIHVGVGAFIHASVLGINCPVGVINRQIFTSKLIAASTINDLAEVERCLANKADVDTRDESNGRTPLHLAAFYNYVDLARMLIDWRANLMALDVSGNMPLHIAASNGNVKIVEMLLDRNVEMVNVRGTPSQFTALHLATGAGCLDVVKCLMKHGANYRIPSRSRKMPVNMARETEILRFFKLIDRLIEMTVNGNEKIISELKKLKIDELMAVTNVRDEMGYNLMQNAIVWKHKAIADKINRIVGDKIDKK